MRTAFIKHHLLNVHTQEILHAKTTVISYKTSGFRNLHTTVSHPEEAWVWGEPSEDPQRLTRGVLYTPGVET